MSHKIKNSGQGQIFSNPYLEVFSKSPPQVSAGFYTLIVLGLLFIAFKLQVVASIGTAVLIFIGAVLFWTLFEYFAHRYLFHLDDYFPNSKFAEKLAFTFHGIHHEYPRDVQRIIMPPAPGLIFSAVLFGLFFLIMGKFVFIFMPGFLTGYLIYTRIHYLTHTKNVPSYLRSQYKHHSLHHYKHTDMLFGVTTSFWDRVFGTMPPAK